MGMFKKQQKEEREETEQPLLLPPSSSSSSSSSSSQDHVGDRDSTLTPTFLLSILAVACGCFATGCTIGYTSPVEYQIIGELGLSVDEVILCFRVNDGCWRTGGFTSRWEDYRTQWKETCKDDYYLELSRKFVFLLLVHGEEFVTRTVNFGADNDGFGWTVHRWMVDNCICKGCSTALLWDALDWNGSTHQSLSGAIPCLVQLLLTMFIIPESPRWLAKTGKKKEFEAALLQLRGGNADISWEVDEIKVGNGLLVLQQFSGMNSYNMYTDVIFVSAGIPSTAGFLAVASFQIVGAFLAATMMDRYGRRPLLQIYEGAIAVWSGIPWMIVAEWNPPGASAVAIGFAVKLVPETRGKTLEEIQSSFTHKMGMTKKQEREETSCSNGEEGRTQAQQPLLLPPSQGHDGGGRDSPLTPTFLLSILAVACGSFSAGCTIGYTSPVEYQIIEELGLSVDEGALQLDLGMLLIGTGASINIYLAPMYVAEITPNNRRGAAVSVTQLTMLCSISFAFLVGSLISWRALAMIGATPCFVQLLLAIFFIPESPRWLAKTGKEKEFEAALLQLRGGNVDISWEVDEIKEYTKIIHGISKNSSILDMFQKQYAIPLIVGNGLLLLQQFSGMNSYAMYTAAIFVSAGIPSTVGFLAVASFQLVATFMAAALMDRYGRRPLLQVGVIGTCLGSLLTALSFILQGFEGWSRVSPTLALLSVMIYSGSISIWSGIPWMIVAEIFPLNIKGSAGTMCCLSSSISGLMVSVSFQSLLRWSPLGTFLMYASVSAVAIGFVAKLVPETRGKTLEEIQSSFSRE
ncbi:unnamed protein product [Linum tenue]|uniref:Major facilitator superfamily (MFS) profile domain-containing protein n=1 Tax=Linum tenue TaxID=586396 RepID=A0AAV0JD90_9ROSI|nr:unnamed protein product [Linum tenue]